MTPPAIPCEGQSLTGALDPRILDAIVRRIVEIADPEKIILFGSAARGEMTRHSDVDLLVIKKGADGLDLMGQIYRRLSGGRRRRRRDRRLAPGRRAVRGQPRARDQAGAAGGQGRL